MLYFSNPIFYRYNQITVIVLISCCHLENILMD